MMKFSDPDKDGDSYLGSKAASGAYQAIIAAMPPHDTYIEPFLGTGAVLQRKPPADRSIGIELDPDVYARAQRDVTIDNAELINGDGLGYMSSLLGRQTSLDPALGRVFIYADPPYLWSTRGASRYRFEFREWHHQRLCAIANSLTSVQALIAISGYPSRMYDDLLAGWRTIEFQVMTRGGPRTEKLWLNYPADQVHWCSYAGSNFTGRQRVKRKAQRWADNYAAMPPGEKLAVLSAMLQVHSQDQLSAPAE